MKRVMRKSMEYKHAIYIKNLFENLKKNGVGTTTIESLSSRMCERLPVKRCKTLVKIVLGWKIQDAHDKLRTAQYDNAQTWRREEGKLQQAGVLEEFN